MSVKLRKSGLHTFGMVVSIYRRWCGVTWTDHSTYRYISVYLRRNWFWKSRLIDSHGRVYHHFGFLSWYQDVRPAPKFKPEWK